MHLSTNWIRKYHAFLFKLFVWCFCFIIVYRRSRGFVTSCSDTFWVSGWRKNICRSITQWIAKWSCLHYVTREAGTGSEWAVFERILSFPLESPSSQGRMYNISLRLHWRLVKLFFFVFVPLCQETLRATNRRLVRLFFEGGSLMCKTPVDFIMNHTEACFYFFGTYFKAFYEGLFILYMHTMFVLCACVCC